MPLLPYLSHLEPLPDTLGLIELSADQSSSPSKPDGSIFLYNPFLQSNTPEKLDKKLGWSAGRIQAVKVVLHKALPQELLVQKIQLKVRATSGVILLPCSYILPQQVRTNQLIARLKPVAPIPSLQLLGVQLTIFGVNCVHSLPETHNPISISVKPAAPHLTATLASSLYLESNGLVLGLLKGEDVSLPLFIQNQGAVEVDRAELRIDFYNADNNCILNRSECLELKEPFPALKSRRLFVEFMATSDLKKVQLELLAYRDSNDKTLRTSQKLEIQLQVRQAVEVKIEEKSEQEVWLSVRNCSKAERVVAWTDLQKEEVWAGETALIRGRKAFVNWERGGRRGAWKGRTQQK